MQVHRPALPSGHYEGVQALLDAERRLLEAKLVTIDVMILYTPQAASRYNRDPRDLTTLAIAQANDTFRNSGIDNVSLRLVHARQIDYDESEGEHFDHLYRMVDGTGAFKDVHRLRDEKRADIVGLVLEDSSGCGLSTRVGADAEEAYFVVHHSCAAITVSIAHEIGHILGAHHDRTVDQSDTPFSNVLGAGADLRPFERALAEDPLLGHLIRHHRGLHAAGALDLFEPRPRRGLERARDARLQRALATVPLTRARLRAKTAPTISASASGVAAGAKRANRRRSGVRAARGCPRAGPR
jgi:metallopeptidase family M12-like protein